MAFQVPYHHSVITQISTIIALCLMYLLVPQISYSQENSQDSVQSDHLDGDTFFDFAFRDEANIVQQGHLGGSRQEMLAQTDEQTENTDSSTDDAENPKGEGLSEPLPNADIINSADDSKSYRVADLTLKCDIEFCRDKENVEALLRTTGLQLGHLTTQKELLLSIERLRKTAYFSNIHQTVKHLGERVEVHFDTVPHTIIRKIVVDDCGDISPSEIKKRMILRPGSPLYPRTALLRGMDVDEISKEKLIQMALEDQEKSLERTYSKEGYFDADVQITPEEIEPNLVDLHVNILDANSYVLGKIYVRGHNIKTYAEIESSFRSEFGFFDHITKAGIEDAVETVLMTYRKAGYYQTKIDYVSRRVPEKKTVDVFLDITESNHWDVQFEGNSALSSKELASALTFEESGYVDRAEVESSVGVSIK